MLECFCLNVEGLQSSPSDTPFRSFRTRENTEAATFDDNMLRMNEFRSFKSIGRKSKYGQSSIGFFIQHSPVMFK